MRALLWMVPAGVSVPGGHLVKLEQTTQALKALGVDATASSEERPRLEAADVVHGFGLTPTQLRWVREQGRPIALSTIYCSPRYLRGAPPAVSRTQLRRLTGRSRTGLALLGAALGGTIPDKCSEVIAFERQLALSYESADILLPDSVRQAEHITSELSTTTPARCVPNAVNPQLLASSTAGLAPLARRDTVLCVGRFEPRKNQLGLIRALRGADYQVVLTGPRHPDHRAYWERCRREASGNVRVLPRRSLAELVELYARARVHVLPSWGETTGLVSLEAAAMGCNVVVSTQGYADEYFADLAWYCEPRRRTSIRAAVDEAYRSRARPELRERVLTEYTWERTAEATLQGYEMITP